jgi:glutathione S-transferase
LDGKELINRLWRNAKTGRNCRLEPSMDTIKLLGRFTSINVRKVMWVAGELGIGYEREDWGKPIRDPNVPEFLALNPNALVPVIVEGNFVLWESNAIIRYLAETRAPGRLLPQEPRQRALVEQWLSWQATELGPTWGYALMSLARKVPGWDDPAKVADSIARWTHKMMILEAQLEKTNAYVAGDVFSLADIAMGLAVHRWYRVPFDRPEMPSVARYYDGLLARPPGRAVMPEDVP